MVTLINNSEIAIRKAITQLNKIGFKYDLRITINKGRYSILKGDVPILLIYKREWFNSYGKIFNKSGIGESINLESFKYALAKYQIRAIARTDGDSLLFADPFRVVETGDISRRKEGVETISFSANLFKHYNTFQEVKNAFFSQKTLKEVLENGSIKKD